MTRLDAVAQIGVLVVVVVVAFDVVVVVVGIVGGENEDVGNGGDGGSVDGSVEDGRVEYWRVICVVMMRNRRIRRITLKIELHERHFSNGCTDWNLFKWSIFYIHGRGSKFKDTLSLIALGHG